MPANFGALELYRGDGLARLFTYTEYNLDTGEETALDLTGYAITFTAKERASDDDEDAVLHVSLSLTDPTNGEATLVLTNDDTDDLDARTYVADVEAVPPGGSPITKKGLLIVHEDVWKG